jgi:hypothetical protein
MFAAHQRLVVAHDSSPCKSGRYKTAMVFHSELEHLLMQCMPYLYLVVAVICF